VALRDDQVATESPGVLFAAFFGTPVINNFGQVAFRTFLRGPEVGTDDRFAVWSEGRTEGAGLVAREGQQVPGLEAGVVFDRFRSPLLNNLGQTAFQATLRGTSIDENSNSAILSESGDNGLRLIAKEGQTAFGFSADTVFEDFQQGNFLRFNNLGQTGFVAKLAGPGITDSNDRTFWVEDPDAGLRLVVQEGQAAPAMLDTPVFTELSDKMELNNLGDAAFFAMNSLIETSIWIDDHSEGLKFAVAAIRISPPTSVHTPNISFLREPRFNDAGQVAFSGFDSDTHNDSYWKTQPDGTVVSVATEGDIAPGTSTTFRELVFPVSMNHRGDVAFNAGLNADSSSGRGNWAERDGVLSLVARSGDTAPDLPPNLNLFLNVLGMVHNAAGQVAFQANIIPEGETRTIGVGIWAQDRNGDLRLIARIGGQIDVDDGPGVDLRTIQDLPFQTFDGGSSNMTGNEDGRMSGFNDRGEVVFRASFTDGSQGVFVSNVVAIPEPSSVMLLMSLLVCLALLRGPSMSHPTGQHSS